MKKLHPDFISNFERMITELEVERQNIYEAGEKALKEQMGEESDVEAIRFGVDFWIEMLQVGFEAIRRWEVIRHYFDGYIQAKIDGVYDMISTDDETEEKE